MTAERPPRNSRRLLGYPIGIIVISGIVAAIALLPSHENLSHLGHGPRPRGGPPSETSPALRDLLQSPLTAAEAALDKGVLTYRRPARLETGVPVILTLTITDIGRFPQGSLTAAKLSGTLGLTVYPGDVPTGGIVGLRTSLCSNLTCQPLDRIATQVIAGQGEQRSWSWELTPEQPGSASVVISTSIYIGAISSPIVQKVIPIEMTVMATPAFNHHRQRQNRAHWWDTITTFLTTALGIVISAGAAVTVIATGAKWIMGRRSEKKKKKGDKKKGKKEPATEPSDSR
jgi:hypothetical protein